MAGAVILTPISNFTPHVNTRRLLLATDRFVEVLSSSLARIASKMTPQQQHHDLEMLLRHGSMKERLTSGQPSGQVQACVI